MLRGWRKPLNPTAWRAEHSQCKTVNTRRQAKYAPALRANSLKKNPPGKATPNKKHAPTGACFQEASAALRRERRPGRRGREAATRTAAPGTAHPDGPSGRRERRRNSGGCRTPGLLRGWRKPLNPTACIGQAETPHRLAGGICPVQNRKYPQAGKVCASLEGKRIKEKPSRQSHTK